MRYDSRMEPTPMLKNLPGGGGLALFRHPDPTAARCRMSNILDSEGNAIILHQLVHAP